MKTKKVFLIITGFCLIFSMLFLPAASRAQDEEIVIPANAHQKAVMALKALGPARGGKKISGRVIDILGMEARAIKVTMEQLKTNLQDLGARETDTGYQIELSGDVLFDFNKWDIREDAEETLQKVAEIILGFKSSRVEITGHTDSKGSEEYNLMLSKKRADSVKNWMVKKAKIPPEIIETKGCGETKPAVENTLPDGSDNPEGRQKNRRVEFYIRK